MERCSVGGDALRPDAPVWVQEARRIAKGGKNSYLSPAAQKRKMATRLTVQNGLTTTRITIPIISTVGTSLTMRQCREGRVLASRANILTA